jgi:hypothetical protein
MTPAAATAYMAVFKYRKGPAFFDGWRVSNETDCGGFCYSVLYHLHGGHLHGGHLGAFGAILTGRAVLWWVFSGKAWPSHVVLWHRGLGYTDSTYPVWNRDLGHDSRTRAFPISLGPIPLTLTAGLAYVASQGVWQGEPAAWLAGLWAAWPGLRVAMGLIAEGMGR